MNYPDDFSTRTFPAGKSIALSRAMGIGIMSAFFIIVCLCGLILWTINSARVEPYVLVNGGLNDQWRVVMAGTGRPSAKMTSEEVLQQSLLWKFTQNWFNISPEAAVNQAIWNGTCEEEYCASEERDSHDCAIFCATNNDLFKRFTFTVLPTYRKYEEANTTWMLVPESMRIDPIGYVSPSGGTWQIRATVLINSTSAMDIVAFARVAHSDNAYPDTMGYYVVDFNSYRISQ
ncbi:MAG: hypothetical protein J6W40_04585 [Alphaproteobacteria bacterium]|nr:hypothetical protein [Alphaproteobacteria bacterium]